MDIDLSSLDAFEASRPALLEEGRRIELAHACGGLLMLERAFADTPIASRLEWELEFGDYQARLILQAPDGREAQASSVCASLEMAAAPPAPPLSDLHDLDGVADAMRRIDLSFLYGCDPAVAQSFSFLTQEQAFALDAPFAEAARYWERFAPALSLKTHASLNHPISLSRSNAPGLARQLGWHEAAAMIEAGRVARDIPPAPADRRRAL